MDIPESGAVFTIGKTFLSDNHQSYFFIKNDAVRKLICGANQSAVICESGRLFVWGENHFGQLGTGSAEIVTKPSCVKVIKSLGHRVRSVAYGETFGIILTEDSKIWFCGKNIFNETDKYRDKFWDLGGGVFVSRKPFELNEFDEFLLDEEGNNEQFVDVAAGDAHFIALTSSGKLYGWGTNESQQLGAVSNLQKPIQIAKNEVVRIVSCGRNCTSFITRNNEIFIVGALNKLAYGNITKINTTSFEDLLYSMYISKENKIFLVINSGEIFESFEDDEITFRPYFMIHENIRKVCTGNGFEVVVTESNKLLTTFNEKPSAKINGYKKIPKELKKFNNLEVLDAVAGLNHILVHATTRTSPNISPEDTSSAELTASTDSILQRMNDLNRTYTKYSSDKENRNIQRLDSKESISDKENMVKGSKIPVSELRRKSSVTGSMPGSRKNSKESKEDEINSNDILKEPENGHPPMLGSLEKSTSLREFEKLEKESADYPDESGIVNDPVIETNESMPGDDQNNNENEDATDALNASPVKQETSNNFDLKVSPAKSEKILNESPQKSIQNYDSLQLLTDQDIEQLESDDLNIPIDDSDPNVESENTAEKSIDDNCDNFNTENENKILTSNENLNGVDEIIELVDENEENGNKINGNEENEDSEIVTLAEETEIETIVAMDDDKNDEEQEKTEPSPIKTVDSLLGEKLNGIENYTKFIMDSKEETKKALKQAFEDTAIPSDEVIRKNNPFLVQQKKDEDDEHTTASIKSSNTPSNNDINENGKELVKNSEKPGPMSRMVKNLKTKGKGFSCTNSDTVIPDANEEMAIAESETAMDKKTTKVCVIL